MEGAPLIVHSAFATGFSPKKTHQQLRANIYRKWIKLKLGHAGVWGELSSTNYSTKQIKLMIYTTNKWLPEKELSRLELYLTDYDQKKLSSINIG